MFHIDGRGEDRQGRGPDWKRSNSQFLHSPCRILFLMSGSPKQVKILISSGNGKRTCNPCLFYPLTKLRLCKFSMPSSFSPLSSRRDAQIVFRIQDRADGSMDFHPFTLLHFNPSHSLTLFASTRPSVRRNAISLQVGSVRRRALPIVTVGGGVGLRLWQRQTGHERCQTLRN